MKQYKYSPGPWRIGGSAPGDASNDFAILSAEGSLIAETFGQVAEVKFEPAEANAHLISAAPEMLEFIEKLIPKDFLPMGTDMDMLRIAEALVRKARGGK